MAKGGQPAGFRTTAGALMGPIGKFMQTPP
jgi:hypothetical protein